MGAIFHDISKYYAANISANLLTVGKIVYHKDRYIFAKDDLHSPFNLALDTDDDVTRMISVIGEIHPRDVLDKITEVDVSSCLYLCENARFDEIEVRSIHKGIGTSVYSKQECPMILWNPNYADDNYFDVIDIQQVFANSRLKNSFMTVIAESLRELELFPPLINFKK